MDGYTVVLDAPERPRSRITIAQLGEYSDKRYGDFAITRNDVESWKANLAKLPGGRALIDLDHRADRSPRNTEAAGWITGIDWDGETPVADVEWTPVGKQAIEDQRYLFFSPTYGPLTTEAGDEIDNVLQGGALTNKPFLTGMPALTLASEHTLNEAAAKLDRENAERLLDTLSTKARNDLPDSAFALSGRQYPIHDLSHARNALSRVAQHGSPEEQSKVKAAVYKKYPELKSDSGDGSGDDNDDSSSKKNKKMDAPPPSDSRDAMDVKILSQLGLGEGVDDDTVVTVIKELQARAETPSLRSLEQRARDNGKVLLDQDDFEQLRKDAASGQRAREELKSQQFDVAFTRALENGRAIPAQRESFENFYELDQDKVLEMLNNGPKIVNTRPSGWVNGHMELDDAPPGIEQSSHTQAQKVRSKLRALGKSMDDFHTVFEQMLADGEI